MSQVKIHKSRIVTKANRIRREEIWETGAKVSLRER